MDTDKQKKVRNLLIIVVPVVLLFGLYYFYFSGNSIASNDTSNDLGVDVEILVPVTKDTSEFMENKLDVYERNQKDKEDSIQAANSKTGTAFEALFNASNDFESNHKIETQPVFSEKGTPVANVNDVQVENKPAKQRISSGNGNRTAIARASRGDRLSSGETVVENLGKNSVNEVEKRSFYSAQDKASGSNDNNGSSGVGASSSKNNTTTAFIKVVIHNDHTVRSGDTRIQFRLVESCLINNILIPANTYLTGNATFGSERCFIQVPSFLHNDEVITTNLNAYEMDGQIGLYAPGAMSQAELKEAAELTASQATEITVPVLGNIKTGALNRRLNQNSLKIMKGYKVLLRYMN